MPHNFGTKRTPIKTLEGHADYVYGGVFSDGQFILTCSADSTARLWTKTERPSKPSKDTAWVRSAVFSPDGQFILTRSTDNTARLWDKNGTPIKTSKGTQTTFAARYFPDGQFILTSSDDKNGAFVGQKRNAHQNARRTRILPLRWDIFPGWTIHFDL